MNQSKSLQELNLMDSFLFSVFTENTQNAKSLAKLIIKRATGREIGEVSVLAEKQILGIDQRHHGIRMDLYIMEAENNDIARVYDIEPNKYNISELPKRSRYSQNLTDVNLLDAGKHYKDLPDYISIWIVSEDPFGKNRMVYTVRNKVLEDDEIQYDDGVTKLFLYVKGEIGGTEDLRKLLQYFWQSEEKNATDKELAELHMKVERMKRSREVGERYMTLQEYIEYEKEEVYQEAKKEGYREGKSEGYQEGKSEGVQVGVEQGIEQGIEQAIKTFIMTLKQNDMPESEIRKMIVSSFKLTEEQMDILLKQ